MRNVKLTLSYDGSDFCGYQIQKGFRSVQEEIQKALSEILQDDITVIGAGRTDSGVHALAQVVNFHHNKNISPKNFVTGLNHFLPDDIRIISAKEVDLKFHSRFDAISKTYEYVIFNDVFMPPIYRKYKDIYRTSWIYRIWKKVLNIFAVNMISVLSEWLQRIL